MVSVSCLLQSREGGGRFFFIRPRAASAAAKVLRMFVLVLLGPALVVTALVLFDSFAVLLEPPYS
ncbi:hypothetical protein ACFSHT_25965 [Paraburkholderia silviterrae]|uniref:Uncharacterized protein n=1 Tax=Paraburkholderia silviterrae TaxID=2528715 RepID=A0A4R5M8R1_9BURK|nr:hypothetical protein EYW47_17950 [Paraburkholderia silviterrae]